MKYRITTPALRSCDIELPPSKSISNRALIIGALGGSFDRLSNLASCDDTRVMLDALQSTSETIDVHDAGTAMRFLTAYFAITPGRKILTGSQRMQQRPIAPLVDALRELGANITYCNREGFPPLLIEGHSLQGGCVTIRGDISSQFISALLLIAPYMEQGITLNIEGKILSRPYIEMTLDLMSYYDISTIHQENSIKYYYNSTLHQDNSITDYDNSTSNYYNRILCQENSTKDANDNHSSYYNRIIVKPGKYNVAREFTVPFDWSAASYWYEISYLSSFSYYFNSTEKSYQGDEKLVQYYRILGIYTGLQGYKTAILPMHIIDPPYILRLDLRDNPDIAQTIIIGCVLKKQHFEIDGLDNLRIKETDRIAALISECAKLGAVLTQPREGCLEWDGESCSADGTIIIDTHGDHRMAMAFAPAAITHGEIWIDNPHVVEKSYPHFWQDLVKAGFCITDEDGKEITT